MTASNHNSVTDGIQNSRSQIAALRDALLTPGISPDQLVATLPGLSKAVANLSAVERQLSSQFVSKIDVARELQQLKADLRGVAQLIEQGAEFHRGWARVLGSAVSGYTASGDAAPLAARGSVALEG